MTTLLRTLMLTALLATPLAAQETTTVTSDSAQTRTELTQILNRLPPQVARALKLDPTLWTNESYLGTYPSLKAFVASHPEVPHSPAYFLEGVSMPGDYIPESDSFRIWNTMMEMMSIFAAILVFGGIFVWLIKTIIDHRRWNRLSRIQAEVHNKLLDRFAANEDLLKYIETSAGRNFLESAPIPLEGGPRAIAAPIGRVLWSVQVGIVIAAAGLGMSFVSRNIDKQISQPMSALGILGMAVGGGFILAAVVSYILSRRLGLWQPPHMEASAGK